ncbi:3'-5' exonuclease [Metapseudomonas otitidis]|uniref:3'-5' exonuclease n=1 Tax=Metapseudomonas otitidis TaxID=319939 RepID=UPI003CF37043
MKNQTITRISISEKGILKKLKQVIPSPEQLKVIRRVKPGFEIIRGVAGSGKTTTAILKLKLFLIWANSRRQREESDEPVRALVLTFNKTLRGYIGELVEENLISGNIEVTVDTFSHWAFDSLSKPQICEHNVLESFANQFAYKMNLPADFIKGEVEYAIGRFLPENIEEYLTCRRDGRGAAPRVEKSLRQEILNQVITPYFEHKKNHQLRDWNDLAIELSKTKLFNYDIIIADESQDFSANVLRAIIKQLSSAGAASFVIDTAQRIYARGFTWSEVGLTIRPENSHRLTVNYRNPPRIARLAACLLERVALDDDGTAPSLFDSTEEVSPFILKGLFKNQAKWCIDYIKKKIDLSVESVAFLHPKGGGWFTYLNQLLDEAKISYIDISRRSEWPTDSNKVLLSTLHSAKGLDFDYVFIIGLSRDCFPSGNFEEGDERLENTCRILAMAIARARRNAVLGYKIGEQPEILNSLDKSLCIEVEV